MFDQLIDLVRLVPFLEIFRPTAGTLGVAAEVSEKIAFRANARFTAPAFEYHGVNRPLPKSTMGSCQMFAAMATLPHFYVVLIVGDIAKHWQLRQTETSSPVVNRKTRNAEADNRSWCAATQSQERGCSDSAQ
jgi:hypothetical protein